MLRMACLKVSEVASMLICHFLAPGAEGGKKLSLASCLVRIVWYRHAMSASNISNALRVIIMPGCSRGS